MGLYPKHLVLAAGLTVACAAPALAVPVAFTAAGADPAAIQATVDAFRSVFGGINNGNTPGSQPDGRREINWDGGGAAAPSTFFPNPMTTFSNRGNVNTSPGGGLQISGQPSPEFDDFNPTYSGIFTPFSSPRLFAPIGSNIVDVLFTVPGTTDVPAFSSGFGAVFTDVDLAGITTLEFFDPFGQSLETLVVPTFNQGLSFAGMTFDGAQISRVRITLGNAALGPNDGGAVDVAVLDDFIYGEPQEVAAPEPATLTLFGAGLAGLVLLTRRSRAVRLSGIARGA